MSTVVWAESHCGHSLVYETIQDKGAKLCLNFHIGHGVLYFPQNQK